MIDNGLMFEHGRDNYTIVPQIVGYALRSSYTFDSSNQDAAWFAIFHVCVDAVAEINICPHDDALIVTFEGLEPICTGPASLLTKFNDWVRLSFRYHVASKNYVYEPYEYLAFRQ